MEKIHEAETFVQLGCSIDGQIKLIKCPFMRLINFLLQHFFCVLVGNIPHHNISSLLVACLNHLNKVLVYQFLILLVIPYAIACCVT